MNLSTIQIVLRRRSLDEIFDLALLMLRRRGAIWKFILPVYFLSFALHLLLFFFYPTDAEVSRSVIAAGLLLLQSPAFVYIVTLAMGAQLFEQRPGWKSVRLLMKGNILYFSARFVFFRLCYQLLLVGILPAWLLGYRDFFAAEVMLLENLRRKALTLRLSALTRQAQERITGFHFFHLVLFIIYLLAGTLAADLFQELTLGRSLLPAELTPGSPVLAGLILAYFVFYNMTHFLFYIDTRSILEGWDVHIMLSASAQDPSMVSEPVSQ
jgi:hypothetical protein